MRQRLRSGYVMTDAEVKQFKTPAELRAEAEFHNRRAAGFRATGDLVKAAEQGRRVADLTWAALTLEQSGVL